MIARLSWAVAIVVALALYAQGQERTARAQAAITERLARIEAQMQRIEVTVNKPPWWR